MPQNAAVRFAVSAPVTSVVPMGNGHINVTYLVTCANGSKYTLQRINTGIFTDAEGLMRNISLVTEYLSGTVTIPDGCLRLVRTPDGKNYLNDNGSCWRMYSFVEGVCIERAESEFDMQMCGEGFGNLQSSLTGFDASQLCETIPRFHDTVNRLHNLELAAEEDKMGRLKDVRAEYEFALARREEAGSMLKALSEGRLKLRVTHNDTKINNLLLDPVTRRPKCVIDLDTVMPGLAMNDFGDCIRSGASTAAEDETDLSRVSLDLRIYRAFAKGFIGACGSNLTPYEISTLPMGAKLMTYECGVRFLTDYLNGDTYFRISHPTHNLERCRTQFALVADTEDKWTEINRIITEEANQ